MFTNLLERRVPEQQGDTLWDQCLQELQRVHSDPITVAKVNRLVVLAAQDVRGDFTENIQTIVNDVLNGFTEELPF